MTGLLIDIVKNVTDIIATIITERQGSIRHFRFN